MCFSFVDSPTTRPPKIHYPEPVHPIAFHPELDESTRSLATSLISSVLQAVDPSIALSKHLDPAIFTAPTHILAFGKASIPMTNAAIECLGDRFARATVISTPDQVIKTQFKSTFVELLVGDHPLPTQRSVDASLALIKHAKSIPPDHQTLVLISGGGSAMLCAPAGHTTLENIITITDTLLKAGAPIEQINKARASLDTLKLGGLAKLLAHTSRTDAYLLCDVINPDPDGDPSATLATIASGPLIDPTQSTDIPHTIIADNQSALDTLCAWLALESISLVESCSNAVGFASDEGLRLARAILNAPKDSATPIAVCVGGEPTVDASSSMGSGGPMLELAIAAAQELIDAPFDWTIITFATDGIDGPTPAAGAVITSRMLDAITPNQLKESLANHDTLSLCDTLNATIITGHTGTNVNDIALIIRRG